MKSGPEQNGPVPVLRVALAQIDLTVGETQIVMVYNGDLKL